MAWAWDFVLQVFDALGGRLTNVSLGNGPEGRKIIATKPEAPVEMFAPDNLIFPISEVELVADRPRIKESSAIGKAERSFFDNYYQSFSWESADRERAVAFLKSIDELPADVREVLSNEFGMDLAHADADDAADRWLLQSRLLGWRGTPVLVPVFELVNHDPGGDLFSDASGIALVGRFAGEVRARRSRLGPFASFWRFGRAVPERIAFSLPMELKTESGISIGIDQNANVNGTLGSIAVPEFTIEDRSVHLSSLMIGSSRNPKLSRGIFYRVMRDAGETNPEQVFDNIAHINRLSFLKLLEALEPHEGGLVPVLRKVVRYQLEAMSWCIGTREL